MPILTMSYIDDIKHLDHPLTTEDMIGLSEDYVPQAYKSMPWTIPGLDHGRALLDSEELLCSYMSAYGQMHSLKLNAVLNSFNFWELNGKIASCD